MFTVLSFPSLGTIWSMYILTSHDIHCSTTFAPRITKSRCCFGNHGATMTKPKLYGKKITIYKCKHLEILEEI